MFDPGPIIRIQSVILLCFGLPFYFMPKYFLSFLTPVQTDGVHWHMSRCSASFFITIPFMFWYWTKSVDRAPRTAAIKSLVLVINGMKGLFFQFSGFALVATIYTKIYAAEYFYSKAMLIIMIFFLVMVLLNIFLLLWSGWPLGIIQFEPERQFMLNRLFLFDAYAAMFIGFLWMCYPDLLLKRQITFPLTLHHAYVCRIFGAILMASNVFGTYATCFKNASDRVFGLWTRFVTSILVLSSQFHSQYAEGYEEWWTHRHWIGMSLWMIWLGIVTICVINYLRGKWK